MPRQPRRRDPEQHRDDQFRGRRPTPGTTARPRRRPSIGARTSRSPRPTARIRCWPDDVTYTINVTNAGPSDAAGVTVVDPSSRGHRVRCRPGAERTHDHVHAREHRGGWTRADRRRVGARRSRRARLYEHGNRRHHRPDPMPGNNSATATTTVATQADVSITKSDAPDPVIAGMPAHVHAERHERRTVGRANVIVTDPLPQTPLFVSAPAGCAERRAPSRARSARSRRAPRLHARSSLAVPANVATGTTLTNTATVTLSTPTRRRGTTLRPRRRRSTRVPTFRSPRPTRPIRERRRVRHVHVDGHEQRPVEREWASRSRTRSGRDHPAPAPAGCTWPGPRYVHDREPRRFQHCDLHVHGRHRAADAACSTNTATVGRRHRTRTQQQQRNVHDHRQRTGRCVDHQERHPRPGDRRHTAHLHTDRPNVGPAPCEQRRDHLCRPARHHVRQRVRGLHEHGRHDQLRDRRARSGRTPRRANVTVAVPAATPRGRRSRTPHRSRRRDGPTPTNNSASATTTVSTSADARDREDRCAGSRERGRPVDLHSSPSANDGAVRRWKRRDHGPTRPAHDVRHGISGLQNRAATVACDVGTLAAGADPDALR